MTALLILFPLMAQAMRQSYHRSASLQSASASAVLSPIPAQDFLRAPAPSTPLCLPPSPAHGGGVGGASHELKDSDESDSPMKGIKLFA
jgi:hypothetical protein